MLATQLTIKAHRFSPLCMTVSYERILCCPNIISISVVRNDMAGCWKLISNGIKSPNTLNFILALVRSSKLHVYSTFLQIHQVPPLNYNLVTCHHFALRKRVIVLKVTMIMLILVLFFLEAGYSHNLPQSFSDLRQLMSIPSFHQLRPKALKGSLSPLSLWYATCNPSRLVASLKKVIDVSTFHHLPSWC